MQPFKVISTLGPASLSPDFIGACIDAGQPSFRLNGSHLSPEELSQALTTVHSAAGRDGVAVALDLQGGKRRIGELSEPLQLVEGSVVRLVHCEGTEAAEAAATDRAAAIPVPHGELFARAELGDSIVLQDGAARLTVVARDDETSLLARVVVAALLRSHCGVHIHGKSLLDGELPAAQRDQVRIAAEYGVAALALSYVEGPSDLLQLRRSCEHVDGYAPRIVAKLERPLALKRQDDIAAAADELWFCRGDLGSQIRLGELGACQDDALRSARAMGKPMVIAGQVFHHLTEHREPTRSEVVHLHIIRSQGACGIVLSDETAIGVDPVGAVRAVVDLL